MSIENIQKLYAMAFKNPSLVEGLNAATDQESYAKMAIELGAANGCDFTAEEVAEWQKAKAAALARNELDDLQLEAVAGGKGENPINWVASQVSTVYNTYNELTSPHNATQGATNSDQDKVIAGLLQVAKMLP
jgi:hypothetical protein